MVVARSTKVGVVVGQCGLGRLSERVLVESAFEDGGDTFIAMSAEDKRAGAGGVESCIAIAFGQSQDTEAGTIALLGVRSFVQDVGNERRGVGADVGGPALQSLG